MKNVLVTGGAGFIGSNFVRYLLKVEPQVRVINLDALTYAGNLENLSNLPDEQRHIFIHGNILDQPLLEDVFNRYAVDTVVHFAAESHVDRSIVGPAAFIQTNINGTFHLLEAARQAWLQSDRAKDMTVFLFHHVSTDEVFGSLLPGEPSWTEKTPYAPNSPYAASKAASDHLVRAYGHTYGLPYTITNSSNNYGPFQFPEKLIPLMIVNALQGKPLPVYGDGKQVRDWLYVEDHCEAILAVIKKGKPGETYNIGGGNQPTNLEVVHALCDVLDELVPASGYKPHRSLIQFVKDRPGHDRRYAMDATKIQRDLGWQPRHTLEEGLRLTVQWYLDHFDWMMKVSKQPEFKAWIQANYKEREL